MKFEVAQCPQCGEAFNRTNPRKEYCRGACRVAAHRERHGYQMPIFDKEQVALVEEVLEILPHQFNELVEDAIKFRILKRMEQRALLHDEREEYDYYSRIISHISNQEFVTTSPYLAAEYSTKFTLPIKKLLEYAEENSITLFKKGNL
jgi:hypothetical protein